MEFVIGGSAAVTSCLFTNPLEVLKTRMQLQGELKARGQHVIHYKNILHAASTIVKNEGVLALQKGLVPALVVQWILNGGRFGIYKFAQDRGYMTDKNGELIFYKSAFFAGFGGVLGQYFSSPFFLVKTHLQSQAAEVIAVGHQYQHKGMVNALGVIYKQNGIKGLFRGALASVPRACVGAASQLTSFEYAKIYLLKYEYFRDKKILTSFCGSMVGGVVISVMMNPFDFILTRLYNQPTDENGKGKLYNNYMDCVRKIYKTEGLIAFYKGVGPLYLRLGPHTVLCLMFWDYYNNLYVKYFNKNRQ